MGEGGCFDETTPPGLQFLVAQRKLAAKLRHLMKVLFIGGTGNISEACARLLAEGGHQVTLITRGQSPVPTEYQQLRADRRNLEQMQTALHGRDLDIVVNFLGFDIPDLEVDYGVLRDPSPRTAHSVIPGGITPRRNSPVSAGCKKRRERPGFRLRLCAHPTPTPGGGFRIRFPVPATPSRKGLSRAGRFTFTMMAKPPGP